MSKIERLFPIGILKKSKNKELMVPELYKVFVGVTEGLMYRSQILFLTPDTRNLKPFFTQRDELVL